MTSTSHHLIVIDLEATCWDLRTTVDEMEIIEIGAVKLDVMDGFKILEDFTTFIRPQQNPSLSAFCTDLTSIQQSDVDDAPAFPEAFPLIDQLDRPRTLSLEQLGQL